MRSSMRASSNLLISTQFDQIPNRVQQSPPIIIIDNDQAYFMVERIIKYFPSSAKTHAQTARYRIKWAGNPQHESTDKLKMSCKTFPKRSTNTGNNSFLMQPYPVPARPSLSTP
mmetsp:Transcript_10713/g.29381  ORF Transcript_10713/g.29381 Transcript_10713/m.29381 type:complete len:114 (-) Transcript_10713:2542-2883(-)